MTKIWANRAAGILVPFVLSGLLGYTATAQSQNDAAQKQGRANNANLASSESASQVEWLEYDRADIDVIDDGIAFGPAPNLVLESDELEGARILYGNPLTIKYKDGSALTLARYDREAIEREFGQALPPANNGEQTLRVIDIPALMLNPNASSNTAAQENPELVKHLQQAGERLLRPMGQDVKRFVAQQNSKQLWFVLGYRESIAFVTYDQQPDQYLMIRSQNMSRSDFLGRVVKGSLQPQGSEWESEDRDIPQQHTIPLPK